MKNNKKTRPAGDMKSEELKKEVNQLGREVERTADELKEELSVPMLVDRALNWMASNKKGDSLSRLKAAFEEHPLPMVAAGIAVATFLGTRNEERVQEQSARNVERIRRQTSGENLSRQYPILLAGLGVALGAAIGSSPKSSDWTLSDGRSSVAPSPHA